MNRPTHPSRRKQLTAQQYAAGIVAGDRAILGRAITLAESPLPVHRTLTQEVLGLLLARTGQAQRVGITGVPGVGKSSLIDALGVTLLDRGHRVAVLAIDPSSPVSRGSILGDKTRMPNLSNDLRAFIRPSPTGGSLGGVARATREAILLTEAAGYDVVLVETVGVGQSEVAVHSLVDFFLLLVLAGAGDELQGIKRGIVELADALVITKADGENRRRAEQARQEYTRAIQFLVVPWSGWSVEVLTCSAATGQGVIQLWQLIERHRTLSEKTGWRAERRRGQALAWMHQLLDQHLRQAFFARPAVQALLAGLEEKVAAGELTPGAAVQRLLAAAGES